MYYSKAWRASKLSFTEIEVPQDESRIPFNLNGIAKKLGLGRKRIMGAVSRKRRRTAPLTDKGLLRADRYQRECPCCRAASGDNKRDLLGKPGQRRAHRTDWTVGESI